MKLTLFAVMLAVLPVVSADARPVTVDDMMRMRTINEVRLSPDGKQVAYTISTPSFESDSHEAVLYVVAVIGGEPVRLTSRTRIFNRPVPTPNLRWSPDSKTVTFLGWVNDLPQVMAIDIAGGEARPLTASATGVMNYEWSPRGDTIAYVAADPPTEEEERRKKERSWVILVDRQDRPVRAWIQPVTAGGPGNTPPQGARALTPPEQFVASLSWSPKGDVIAYGASLITGWMSQFNTHLYTIPSEGGDSRRVVNRPGMNGLPVFSPDGKWIAFTSTAGRMEMVSTWGLHIVSADGNELRNLSEKSETWAGEYVWSPDSRSILQIPGTGTGGKGLRMFDQPIVRVSIDTAASEQLTPDGVVAYWPNVTPDGKLMVYRSVEARTMGDLVVMALGTRQITRLTEINPQIRDLSLGNLSVIQWKSFDGMDIYGLLLTPPGYRPGIRVPLLVYCHGGPIGGFTLGIFPQFMHRVGQVDPYGTEAMASAGMAVLFPMPRGGSGYGEDGFRMILKNWGVPDYQDIMTGVDHVIGMGVADPDRLGVMGASYGGFMTSWIVTQTGRFKAASTGASVTDLEGLYYFSDAGEVTREYFGEPWESRELYFKHSPVSHAQNVTTPLLIQHGENDRRVPLSQAIMFYRALKKHGKYVEFEIYPGAGHVYHEPDMERQVMQRNLDWFTRWLKPTPLAATQ